MSQGHASAKEMVEREELVAYLPIQRWFMCKEIKHRHHFNHSFLIQVDGRIDKEQLHGALERLNARHDALRAVYRDGKQWCRKTSRVPEIREWDVSEQSADATFKVLTEWQSRFNLEQGYIWQAGIIRGYADGSERIFLAVHHLAIDAASWPTLRQDLKALYEGIPADAAGSRYALWAEAVNAYGKNAPVAEKRYWEAFRKERQIAHNAWKRLADDGCDDLNFTKVDFAAQAAGTIQQVAHEVFQCTIPELLLGVLGHAIVEVSGQRRNWITLESAGREAIDPDLDVHRTVGWFTVLYPFCLQAGETVRETVRDTIARLRQVPRGGIGYGAIYGYEDLPPALFNFIPYVGGTSESQWPIRILEPSGESMHPDNRYGNIVDINGIGAAGAIRLGLESGLTKDRHEQLCESFRRNMADIAAALRGRS